mmetsp:Transcript_7390/g.8916  ORF Transcript_7390/g.8916 Transcript_7390/m.8916 type:complete len:116 (+) Transcript_7390:264-611(+)
MRPECNFLLEVSAVDACGLASYATRQERLRDAATMSSAEANVTGDDVTLNTIDVIPRKVQVREAQLWQNKDTSKIKDFSQVEEISDWTYSTPYKGSIHFLSKELQKIRNSTALEV